MNVFKILETQPIHRDISIRKNDQCIYAVDLFARCLQKKTKKQPLYFKVDAQSESSIYMSLRNKHELDNRICVLDDAPDAWFVDQEIKNGGYRLYYHKTGYYEIPKMPLAMGSYLKHIRYLLGVKIRLPVLKKLTWPVDITPWEIERVLRKAVMVKWSADELSQELDAWGRADWILDLLARKNIQVLWSTKMEGGVWWKRLQDEVSKLLMYKGLGSEQKAAYRKHFGWKAVSTLETVSKKVTDAELFQWCQRMVEIERKTGGRNCREVFLYDVLSQ